MSLEFQSLEAQLLRALAAGDSVRISELLNAGADPFTPVALAELSTGVRGQVEQFLARRMPPNMENNDG